MSAGLIGRFILSAALGIGAGVVLHFMLYRFGLPAHPFIYQVF